MAVPPAQKKMHGFSLIEAMVVMAVVTIMLAFAIPNMSGTKTRTDLESARKAVSQALNMGRQIAVSHSGVVTLTVAGSTISLQTASGSYQRSINLPSSVQAQLDVVLNYAPDGVIVNGGGTIILQSIDDVAQTVSVSYTPLGFIKAAGA